MLTNSCGGSRFTLVLLWVGFLSAGMFTERVAAQFGPPLDDMKLWLSADEGISADIFGGIANWDDQGPGPVFHNSAQVLGQPLLGSFDFINGSRDVVEFSAGSGFLLENEDDMFICDVSIYAVVIPPAAGGQTIVGNYKDATGYVFGLSDFTARSIKWFTAGAGHDSLESGQADVTAGVPVLLTATIITTGEAPNAVTEKRVYVDRALITETTDGSQPFFPEPPEHHLTVGYLLPSGGPSQFFGGSIAEIIIYESVSDEQREEAELYLTQKYFTEGFGPAAIVEQPENQSVSEGDSVTFSVTASGTLPYAYEWRRNGAAIPGADGPDYTIDIVTRANQGAEFTVNVSNGLGGETSNIATLTVVDLDNAPPTIASAQRSLGDTTVVFLVFDEDVSGATASLVGNYAINNGIVVNGAQLAPGSSNTVLLNTSAIDAGSSNTLTVSGVEDILGNIIAANTPVIIQSPAFGPPPDDLKLWLSADTGVATELRDLPEVGAVTAVTGWFDQAANAGIKHHSIGTRGVPTLASTEFPAGELPAVRFDGQSSFQLDNEDDMFLETLSVYAVIAPTASTGQTIVGNYKDATGFVLGQSDNQLGEVKWFTAGAMGHQSMEANTAIEDLQTGFAAFLTATYGGGLKSLYLNRFAVLDGLGVPLEDVMIDAGPTYPEPPDHMLTIGALEPGTRQFFTGDIAEILIYSSVSSSQRAGVESYLTQKYISGSGTGTPEIAGQPESQMISEGSSVTFCVAATGALPFTYEWSRDGTPIPDSTNSCYTIDVVSRTDQGAELTVSVTNSFGTDSSDTAVLTVIDIDETPPHLDSAQRSLGDATRVFVTFDEFVTDATASVSTNYTIDSGATVDSAQLVGGSGNTVVLGTSAINSSAVLRVSNIEDSFGNIITPNSSISISVSTRVPSQQDLKLWLTADTGVATTQVNDIEIVTSWLDQALNGGIQHDSVARFGNPTLASVDFPRGSLPVVRFDGGDGFQLANEDDMFLENLTIYAVIVPTANSGQTLVGNYKDATGFVLGQSDNLAGEIKWFTADPLHSLEADTGVPDFVSDTPVTLTATIDAGLKSLYLDGAPIAGANGPLENVNTEAGGPTPTYTEPPEHMLTVGVLEPGSRQFFTGDVAEILIYASVSELQRDEVWAYLQSKYFDDLPSEPIFRRGDHDGSGLVDITDPLNLLGFLFLGQTPPICADASDGDNSGALDISDALNVLGFLFLGSFPLNDTLPGSINCGPDPAFEVDLDGPGGFPNQPPISLGCDIYPSATGLPCQ